MLPMAVASPHEKSRAGKTITAQAPWARKERTMKKALFTTLLLTTLFAMPVQAKGKVVAEDMLVYATFLNLEDGTVDYLLLDEAGHMWQVGYYEDLIAGDIFTVYHDDDTIFPQCGGMQGVYHVDEKTGEHQISKFNHATQQWDRFTDGRW